MKKHYRKEQECANCGAQLQGKFCHVCGQENLELHESFGHMMNHAISDYFHFDHQFFHTLKPLFFQPGKLTIDYMAGKRVQYLHPVKMYIFISLIFFILVFRTDKKENQVSESKNPKTKKELAATNKKLDSLIKDTNSNELERSILKKAKANTQAINIHDDEIDLVGSPASEEKGRKHRYRLWEGNDDAIASRQTDTTYELYLAHQAKLPSKKQDNFFMRYVRKREYELNANGQNPKEIIVEGIKHYAPKVMFLILPLFALLLSITFSKNKKFYVEHLIYSFHYHCFLFLFLSIIMLIELIIPHTWNLSDFLNTVATVAIAWYSYKSLRTVYNRSRGRTITKMIGLFFSYSLVFAFCMMILVMGVALFD